MLRTVTTAYADTRADDLRWSLHHPILEPLTAVGASIHGRSLSLNVLGASHQVVVEAAGHQLVETVAYLPDVPQALPRPGATSNLEFAAVGSTYDIATRVDRLAPEMVRDRARWLKCHLGSSPTAVVAEFPGVPDAVTALSLDAVRPQHIGWTTWHVYPQHQQVVRTRTRIAIEKGQDNR